MSAPLRLVFDTNVLVSTALTTGGVSSQAVARGVEVGVFLLSEPTLAEVVEVLHRPKLQKYLPAWRRDEVVRRVIRASSWVEVGEPFKACRDPKDDKFLDAAVYGQADYLVTGDDDLLALGPFRGIPILTPAAFLDTVETQR